MPLRTGVLLGVAACLLAVGAAAEPPAPQYFLDATQTHNKFSRTIPPALRVPSGAVVQVETQEATDGQLTLESTPDDVTQLDFEPIHPLTGPIYVEGAAPGDVLAVTLHRIEVGAWGWTAISPGFGFLSDEFTEPWIRTFPIAAGARSVRAGVRCSASFWWSPQRWPC